jgi:hypothetical protein
MIRHFKDHSLSILTGVDATFPPSLWDLLLPQAKPTINLLRQATANPKILVWEYFNGAFAFNKTPLAPVGCRVLIHAKPGTRRSWDYRAKQGFYMGPALDHYRCYKLVKSKAKQKVISNTVQFRHAYLQIPAVSEEDKILNGLQVMVGAMQKCTPAYILKSISCNRGALRTLRKMATPGTTLIVTIQQGTVTSLAITYPATQHSPYSNSHTGSNKQPFSCTQTRQL